MTFLISSSIVSAFLFIAAADPTLPAKSIHRMGSLSIDPKAQASIEKVRRNSFQPYDETKSHRVNYGGVHPWEQQQERRFLSSSTHQPIRIHFYTKALEAARGQSDEKDRRIDILLNDVLPRIANVWSQALSVVPADGITVGRDSCGDRIDLDDDLFVEGADLVIAVDGVADANLGCVEGASSGALAIAFPCQPDQWDRPVVGFINFCLEISLDLDKNNLDGEISNMVALGSHEVGHVLGMSGDFVKYFRDFDTGEPRTQRPFQQVETTCVDGSVRIEYSASLDSLSPGITIGGARYYEVTTPRVATVVRNQFSCPSLKGARLENQPTSATSCFGGHLDERYYFTELMGAIFGRFSNALSPVTLAIYEDSGWYTANYSNAETSVFGYGAGCGFVNDECIKDGEVPDYAKGFFCNDQLEVTSSGLVQDALTCDPSRTHKTACDLADRSSIAEDIPGYFQYFPDEEAVGAYFMPLADFCPIPSLDYMDCQDPSNSAQFEYYGADSRCYDIVYDSFGGERSDSMCLKTTCNAEQNVIEVVVDGSKITCDYDFQMHSVGNMQLECPRFAVVCPELVCPGNCAGRGICNWDAAGGPRCECFDATDASVDCFGSKGSNTQMAPTSNPQPKLLPTLGPIATPTQKPVMTPTTSLGAKPSGTDIQLSPQPSSSNGRQRNASLTADMPTSAPSNFSSSAPTETFGPTAEQTGQLPSLTPKVTLFPTVRDETPTYDGPTILLGPSSSAASTALSITLITSFCSWLQFFLSVRC